MQQRYRTVSIEYTVGLGCSKNALVRTSSFIIIQYANKTCNRSSTEHLWLRWYWYKTENGDCVKVHETFTRSRVNNPNNRDHIFNTSRIWKIRWWEWDLEGGHKIRKIRTHLHRTAYGRTQTILCRGEQNCLASLSRDMRLWGVYESVPLWKNILESIQISYIIRVWYRSGCTMFPEQL